MRILASRQRIQVLILQLPLLTFVNKLIGNDPAIALGNCIRYTGKFSGGGAADDGSSKKSGFNFNDINFYAMICMNRC